MRGGIGPGHQPGTLTGIPAPGKPAAERAVGQETAIDRQFCADGGGQPASLRGIGLILKGQRGCEIQGFDLLAIVVDETKAAPARGKPGR